MVYCSIDSFIIYPLFERAMNKYFPVCKSLPLSAKNRNARLRLPRTPAQKKRESLMVGSLQSSSASLPMDIYYNSYLNPA